MTSNRALPYGVQDEAPPRPRKAPPTAIVALVVACTVLAVLRMPVFNVYMPRENDMNTPIPSVDSMGVAAYFKYMSTLVLFYCVLIFMIQAFTTRDLLLTLARIGASTVLSVVLILGLDSLVSTRREKRL